MPQSGDRCFWHWVIAQAALLLLILAPFKISDNDMVADLFTKAVEKSEVCATARFCHERALDPSCADGVWTYDRCRSNAPDDELSAETSLTTHTHAHW